MQKLLFAAGVALLGAWTGDVKAQAQPQQKPQVQFVVNGAPMAQGGEKLQINEDQKLMFEAAGKVVKNDFKGAEAIYNQVLSRNNSNIEAFLQRGIVRRELGDLDGAVSDGRSVVTLANGKLRQNPNDAYSYHQRGMGLRLLKDYNNAKADISKAIQMSGQASWKTDLQAIELEQKAFK
jgi:tetratricopeptide (TPR) repeat protein